MDIIQNTAKSELENCSIENSRLDAFIHNMIARSYPTALMVVEMALVLSNGQATLEKGFSDVTKRFFL